MALKVHEKRTVDVVKLLYRDIFQENPMKYIQSTNCIIFDGKCLKSDNNGGFYGRITRTYNGKKHDLFTHQVVWMASQEPPAIFCPAHVSHLCHNSLCLNSEHLVCEPQAVNNQRIKCHNDGYCYWDKHGGHHFLDKNMERVYTFQ